MASKPLPAFSEEEYRLAHLLLASRVAHMMGRKFEEGDWADVYCGAKNIPRAGWSNLHVDVVYKGLGVEHKMLMKASDRPIATWCGTSLMHPSATRAIRINSTDRDPSSVMHDVLDQYGELIARRTKKVEESCYGCVPDMRIGWLLWQDSLREFMYFEEVMAPPNPNKYFAQWHERTTKGGRLGSKNLWIYDKDTGQKRYSVTTDAGVKLQPYFDVPPFGSTHLYHFRVQGEQIGGGMVRVWLTTTTLREIHHLVGTLEPDQVSDVILNVQASEGNVQLKRESDEVGSIIITEPAYDRLVTTFEGVSDEHRFRLLASQIRQQG